MGWIVQIGLDHKWSSLDYHWESRSLGNGDHGSKRKSNEESRNQ